LENLEELNKFQDTSNLPKLIQDNVNNLNESVMNNGVEAVIKEASNKERSRIDGFTDEFNQTYKEELNPMFLKLFHK
jgi:hypothetical protein